MLNIVSFLAAALWWALWVPIGSAFPPTFHGIQTSTFTNVSPLYSSSPYSWESDLPKEDDQDEETLLRIRLKVKPGVSADDALTKVQRYTQSFPFAAVLPVQPLQYLPTHDGGVDVLFLRKKTQEKGSIDGGIRFFVRGDSRDENSQEEESVTGIDILAKRNSQGQSIPKTFSEKLVVQTFVKGLSGEETVGQVAPTEAVSVESIFHPWLEL